MIDFVHISADSLGKDADTKRRVRVQAMRDYRERQRTNASTHKSKLNLPTFTPKIYSVSQPSEQMTVQNRPNLTLENEDHAQRDKPKRRRLRSRQADQKAQKSLRLDVSPRHVRKEHSIALPAYPFHGYTETIDPFDSPFHVNHMLGLCRSWVTWLLPVGFGDRASDVLHSAWQHWPSPFMLAPSLLASIGYLEATQPGRPRCNDSIFKAKLLREINKRMTYDPTSTSDAMISALLLLTSFELVRLSRDSIVHLQGLKKIVEIKGGWKQLGPHGAGPSLTMMFELLDLLQAIVFCSEPFLMDLTPGQTSGEENEGLVDSFRHLRSALVLDLDTSDRGPTTNIPETLLTDLNNLLDSAADSVSLLSSKRQCDEGGPAGAFFDRLSLFNERHCDRDPTRGSTSTQLARACHQSMAILYNLVINRNPIGHSSNESYTDGLFRAIRSFDDEIWSAFPYLQVWILLTGLLISTEPSRRSFFQAHLIRRIYKMGPANWASVKGFIVHYLLFKHGVEQRLACNAASPTPTESTGSWPSPVATPEKRLVPPNDMTSISRISDAIAWSTPLRLDHFGGPNTIEVTAERKRDSIADARELLESDRLFLQASFTGGYWFTANP